MNPVLLVVDVQQIDSKFALRYRSRMCRLIKTENMPVGCALDQEDEPKAQPEIEVENSHQDSQTPYQKKGELK